MSNSHTRSGMDCLGRTCLKWQSDGELSALDRSLILERLQQVDAMRERSVNAPEDWRQNQSCA